MSFERVTDIVQRAQLAAGDKAGSSQSTSADREQIKTVAAQFESLLLAQMLKDMRKSESWDDEPEAESDGLGAESFFETLDVELATHLAKVKGFGLSQQLIDALEGSDRGQTGVRPGSDQGQTGVRPGSDRGQNGVRTGSDQGLTLVTARLNFAGLTDHLAVNPGTVSVEPAGIPPEPAGIPPEPAGISREPAGIAASKGGISVNPGGEVTSQFGWRRDPFTGKAKFHRGIDVRAAYGEDIQTAGAGRVVFSGHQRGYGNTVIVQHPDGVQTRYGHLSAALVSAGDELKAGQVVGRAGRSGRATGTHLHFEVIANGKQVDPLKWAEKWAETAHESVRPEALKHTGVVADLAISDQSRTRP
jgi:murein DD-endopeptidase MepM/ murein hydrolase activator NlpD